jgi:hypothetical protein
MTRTLALKPRTKTKVKSTVYVKMTNHVSSRPQKHAFATLADGADSLADRKCRRRVQCSGAHRSASALSAESAVCNPRGDHHDSSITYCTCSIHHLGKQRAIKAGISLSWADSDLETATNEGCQLQYRTVSAGSTIHSPRPMIAALNFASLHCTLGHHNRRVELANRNVNEA